MKAVKVLEHQCGSDLIVLHRQDDGLVKTIITEHCAPMLAPALIDFQKVFAAVTDSERQLKRHGGGLKCNFSELTIKDRNSITAVRFVLAICKLLVVRH